MQRFVLLGFLMHFGILDLGTASLRATVFQRTAKRPASGHPLPLKPVYHQRFMPRLGSSLYQTGRLSEKGREETMLCCEKIVLDLEKFPKLILRAAATSALREAEDGGEFIYQIQERFSLPMSIIDGVREAELTAKGILAFDDLPDEPLLCIDIGGGSTEVSFVAMRKIEQSLSLPLGSIRCSEMFLKPLPPCPSAIEALHDSLYSHLDSLRHLKGKLSLAVGSSAAARTLCRVFGCEYGAESMLSREQVKLFTRELSLLTSEQTAQIPGIEESRADIVLAGCLLLHGFLEFLEIPSVRASRYSLRHGLLSEAYEEFLKTSGDYE